MFCGPSEVTIVCDKKSNPDWLASDLVGQAEHSDLVQCILISKDRKIIEKTRVEILKQVKKIPRSLIAKKSLMKYGILLHVNSDKKIIEIINKLGPEHLELNIKNYKSYVRKIKSSGSICLGDFAVMSLTDMGVPGSNHVLPTNFSSKYSSGLNVSEYMKSVSFITLSKQGVDKLGPSAITLAENEGLYAHAQSIIKRIRRK